jgi:hypothetical protein
MRMVMAVSAIERHEAVSIEHQRFFCQVGPQDWAGAGLGAPPSAGLLYLSWLLAQRFRYRSSLSLRRVFFELM